MEIQKAFRRLFVRKRLPSDWTTRLLPLLKAYAHPRRERIVQAVLRHQPISYADLHRRVGFCENSFCRHLAILRKAGVLLQVGVPAAYSIAKPVNSLSAAFLSAIAEPTPRLI